jgi:hypothetical protein
MDCPSEAFNTRDMGQNNPKQIDLPIEASPLQRKANAFRIWTIFGVFFFLKFLDNGYWAVIVW